MSDKIYLGIVDSITSSGRHGPYATAMVDHPDIVTLDNPKGFVTFSLEPTVWQEEDWPETGTYVVLWTIIRKRKGWRAKKGRYLKPSDEVAKETHRKGVVSNEEEDRCTDERAGPRTLCPGWNRSRLDAPTGLALREQ